MNETQIKIIDIEVKNADGVIRGIAATTKPDKVGDVFTKESIENCLSKQTIVPCKIEHKDATDIKWNLKDIVELKSFTNIEADEGNHGLDVEATYDKTKYKNLKEYKNLSVGIVVNKCIMETDSSDKPTGRRIITDFDLMEISLVKNPCNDKAMILEHKSAITQEEFDNIKNTYDKEDSIESDYTGEFINSNPQGVLYFTADAIAKAVREAYEYTEYYAPKQPNSQELSFEDKLDKYMPAFFVENGEKKKIGYVETLDYGYNNSRGTVKICFDKTYKDTLKDYVFTADYVIKNATDGINTNTGQKQKTITEFEIASFTANPMSASNQENATQTEIKHIPAERIIEKGLKNIGYSTKEAQTLISSVKKNTNTNVNSISDLEKKTEEKVPEQSDFANQQLTIINNTNMSEVKTDIVDVNNQSTPTINAEELQKQLEAEKKAREEVEEKSKLQEAEIKSFKEKQSIDNAEEIEKKFMSGDFGASQNDKPEDLITKAAAAAFVTAFPHHKDVGLARKSIPEYKSYSQGNYIIGGTTQTVVNVGQAFNLSGVLLPHVGTLPVSNISDTEIKMIYTKKRKKLDDGTQKQDAAFEVELDKDAFIIHKFQEIKTTYSYNPNNFTETPFLDFRRMYAENERMNMSDILDSRIGIGFGGARGLLADGFSVSGNNLNLFIDNNLSYTVDKIYPAHIMQNADKRMIVNVPGLPNGVNTTGIEKPLFEALGKALMAAELVGVQNPKLYVFSSDLALKFMTNKPSDTQNAPNSSYLTPSFNGRFVEINGRLIPIENAFVDVIPYEFNKQQYNPSFNFNNPGSIIAAIGDMSRAYGYFSQQKSIQTTNQIITNNGGGVTGIDTVTLTYYKTAFGFMDFTQLFFLKAQM